MSYIGNPIVSTDFPVDYKSGNGSTTAFTLSVAPASVNSIDVQISGVSQSPQTYSVSGTTLTFSAAPPAGTNNIVVRHLGIAGIPNVPAAASVTPSALSTPNAVYWDVSNNVGIGTTSPAQKLHVNTSSNVTFLGQSSSGSNTAYVYLQNATSSSTYTVGYGSIGDNAIIGAGGAERMRIDSSGNVGIGVIPSSWGTSYKAQQIGQAGVIAGHTAVPAMTLASNAYENSGWKAITTNPSHRIDLSSDNNATIFYRAASATAGSALSYAESMRIDSSGNLLVSKTAQDLAVAGFQVRGDAPGLAQITRSGGEALGLNRLASDGSIALFYRQTAQVGSISVTTSATAYNTSSDYRLKENIAPMQNALSVVQQLKPVTYTWKSTGKDSQGFIAHELQAVVPDCVTGEKDAVDADGKPVYQGIDTSFLVATLTAAIQELNAKVEAQALEIKALKGTV